MTIAYFEGEFRPLEDAKVSITTHIFNYGLGAFAGIRAYWNETHQQLFVFRPGDHFQRLRNAASILRCDDIPSADELTRCTVELFRRNNFREDAYCRSVLYKGEGPIGARLHGVPSHISMFAQPMGRLPSRAEGIRIGTSSWRRPSDNAIPSRGKICGAYVTSALAKSDAVDAGYDEPLLLDEQGHVAEGSAANIFLIKDGAMITPPVYGDILEGITRRTIIQLANDHLGVSVVERPIDRSELYSADELFFCGTGWEIAPIAAVDGRSVVHAVPGNITEQLSHYLHACVRGELPEYSAWCIPVYT